MKYRSEIDGLRALAVVPVVLCHAQFSLFAGGYVGVDVFFVISGYLITRIIVDDIDAQRFSLIHFYERRARRILPALFAMMLACIPVAYATMMPDFLQNFGQSLIATTLFANNVLLSMTSGYWSLESSFKPLLHTWSLGVEEQYYLIVPLLLLAASRLRGSYLLGITVTLGAGSLVLFAVLSISQPNFAFYQLPTRAWELMLGASAVLWERGRPSPPRDGRLAGIGLIMILGSVFLIRPGGPWMSLALLVPCAGAALILVFGRAGTAVGRLLSWAPVAFVGLISYSLYLWHQPVFAFTRVVSLQPPSAAVMLLMVFAVFAIALLSWRFVEKPFRDPKTTSRAILFLTLAPAALALCAVGLWFHVADGVPSRVFKQGQSNVSDSTITYNEAVFQLKRDTFRTSGPLRLLVIGNSQARDFVNMAQEANRFDGYDIVYRDDLDLCAPLTGVTGSLVRNSDYIIMTVAGPLCDRLRNRTPPIAAKRIVFVGPKHFGYNINAFIFVTPADRPAATAAVPGEIVENNRLLRSVLPRSEYVDLLSYLSPDGTRTPVFDSEGSLLTPDRVHVTRAGAALIGSRIFTDAAWADFPYVSPRCQGGC